MSAPETRPLALWSWPFTTINIPSPADPITKDPDQRGAPVPPAIKMPVEASLIRPLRPLQPPSTSLRSVRGNLQLEVAPNTAQVYVDGFYVGTVEDANRSLTGLMLEVGWHRLGFRAPGYETSAANVTIEPNRTITYSTELKPISR